jgi:hypothetical protein
MGGGGTPPLVKYQTISRFFLTGSLSHSDKDFAI